MTNSPILYTIKVIPRSSKNEVTASPDGILKVKLTAAPVDGAANAALIEVLADYLKKTLNIKVKKTDIEIIKGMSSRVKIVRIND
ncbi:MAG: DUF167 domain-containing protein [Nitrospirae bacterium]|nr:DUF167 domain-containing protein [Nitrospirota bacterium]